MSKYWAVLRDAWRGYRLHDAPMLSGAVAFYTLLALAPLGVVAVMIAGVVLGEEAAAGELQHQLDESMGPEMAGYLAKMVERAGEFGEGGWLATLTSVGFLAFASLRLFWMLRAALNHAWGIRSTLPPGFRGLRGQVLRRRLSALVLVLIFGPALVSIALLRTVLDVVADTFGALPFVVHVADIGVSVLALTLIVAAIYRWVPDAIIAWRDVLAGAWVTSLLAGGGSFLFGHYLSRVVTTSMYGAASTLVVLMLWVYTSAQLFFFGANVTIAWARLNGDGVEPRPYARRLVLKHEDDAAPEGDPVAADRAADAGDSFM